MAGIRYDSADSARVDLAQQAREIRIRGKGGRERAIRITHQASRTVDRLPHAAPDTSRRGGPRAPRCGSACTAETLTVADIYQPIARRSQEAGVAVRCCAVFLGERELAAEGGNKVADYHPMTAADLAAYLSQAEDDKTRWKLVWEFLKEYRWEQAEAQPALLADEPARWVTSAGMPCWGH